MKAKNLIRIILFSLLAIDCTVVSAQNCEEIFLNRLEQTYYRRKPHFIKQVRNAVISPKVVNLPDLQTLPEDSIILIGKVFFTKNYGSRSKKGEFLRFELSHNALNRKPQK